MEVILNAEIFTIPWVSFVVGLLFCFLGRKILPFIVVLFGFLIGYTWFPVIIVDILGHGIQSWVPWALALAGAALGLIAWKVSMFFAGALIGLFVARGLLPELSGIVHVAIGLGAGILVHIYKDPIIALLTSIAGAYIATGSAMLILEQLGFTRAVAGFTDSADPSPVIGIVLLLIFAITGYKFQARGLGT